MSARLVSFRLASLSSVPFRLVSSRLGPVHLVPTNLVSFPFTLAASSHPHSLLAVLQNKKKGADAGAGAGKKKKCIITGRKYGRYPRILLVPVFCGCECHIPILAYWRRIAHYRKVKTERKKKRSCCTIYSLENRQRETISPCR